MSRPRRRLVGILSTVLGLTLVAAQAGAAADRRHPGRDHPAPQPPTKVVIVVVDALSREIVDDYQMRNVQALMDEQVDTPRGYLGHLGSVTVVTHNVLTSGALPRNMGWSDDGMRDTEGLLGDPGQFWIPSDLTMAQMFALQADAGYPKLADYLHQAQPDKKVFTVSPKAYAAWAFGGSGSDSIITFTGATCPTDGLRYRAPTGVNVPSYIAAPCGRFWVRRGSGPLYDTGTYPASLYSAQDDRYLTGHDPARLGGDVWATDAALAIMDNEEWSGLFVTLPGVDKAAHMWGGVDDPGGADPMTHLEYAAATADAQVGRIIDKLKADGEYDNTLVVLTADHGSVPARQFYGETSTEVDYGFYNWYYGSAANGTYLRPQAALKPLVDTGNVGLTYSDSMLRVWLKDNSPAKVAEAAEIMAQMPAVSAAWTIDGDHYDRASRVRWDLMSGGAERSWFARRAQELVNTEAAPYGPDVIATLVDDTTYSVAGDHGGIQRRAQQIPIVFAGAGLGSRDLMAPVRSVDVLPTVLLAMGITPTHPLDGIAYRLLRRGHR